MRSSRLSREVAKLFDATTVELSSLPSRRTTRASLAARFAYTTNVNATSTTTNDDDNDNGDSEDGDDKADVTFSDDIEDAIQSTTRRSTRNGAPATQSRKRKRATTTTMTIIKPDEEGQSTTTTTTKIEIETESATTTTAKPRRARKPARVKTDPVDSTKTVVTPPSDWEETYAVVQAMRAPGGAASGAAVDTMGCERLAGSASEADARERRFHTLVALMLSSQTKDTVNAEVMGRLRTELPPCAPGAKPGLTLENILAVEPDVLNEMIWKVGFHNNKTKYIKEAAVILRDKYDSDIPPTIEGLMSLPGVGPKMAYLCMSAENGWNRVEGIGVDVHVHRITNLWGWQSPPTRTPEETRLALQAWLPRDKWKEINWLLVGLGQAICLPVGRRCGDCELGLRGLCKAAERKKVTEGRKRREEMKIEADGLMVKKEEIVEEEVVREAVVNKTSLGEELKEETKKEIKEEIKEED